MKDFPIAFELDIVKAKKKNKIKKDDWVLYGYASTFDVDSDDAQITKEALLGAKNDLIKYNTVLFNHNNDRPIGKVIETAVDNKGLLVTIVLSKEESELWNKVLDGTMSKFSIRGRALETRWTDPNDEGLSILQIIKLKLFEVSLVSVPANVEASTLSSYVAKYLKDKDMKITKEQKEEIEKSLIGELQLLAGKLSGDDKKLIEDLLNLLGGNMDEKQKKAEYDMADESKERPVFQLNLHDEVSVELDDKNRFKKTILKLGKWYHWAADGGVLNVTKEMVDNITKNFKNKTLENVSVPLTHTNDPSKNTGEVVELIKTEDGLDAICEIKDESIVKKIKDGIIKSISASIDPNYMVKTDKKFVGPTLLHAALVQEPFIKGMGGFVELGEDFEDRTVIQLEDAAPTISAALELITKGQTMLEELNKEEKKEETTEEKKEETTTEKPDVEKKEDETEEKKEDIKKSTEETTEEGKTETEVKSDDTTAPAKVDLADAETLYKEYLDAGKIVPAQKEAFMRLFSTETVNLGDEQVGIVQKIKDLFASQHKVIDFEEKGTTETEPTTEETTTTEEKPLKSEEEIKGFYKDKMGLSDEATEEAVKNLKKIREEEEDDRSTIF